MCFEVITEIIHGRVTGRKFIVIDGVKYSPEVEVGDLLAFLEHIEKHGGEKAFQENIAKLLSQLKPVSKKHLQELKYGVRFLRTNYDIYDPGGEMIFRGKAKFMDNFLQYSNLPGNELRLQRLAQTLDQWQDDLAKYAFNPDLFTRVTGVDYPGEITRGLGYSPDFGATPEIIEEFVYLGDPGNANVLIKVSGNYAEDFRRANRAAQIDPGEIPEGGVAPGGFVWNHFDEIGFAEDGAMTCIMQLVRKEIHNKVVQAPSYTGALNRGTEHAGLCAIWKRYYDIVKYKY